jgi:hypothetical protein
MARIVEYDERGYGDGQGRRGVGGGGAGIAIIVILFILYYSGYMPAFSTVFTAVRPTEVISPVEAGTMRLTRGVGQVTADNLNMRASPGKSGQATYILPRGTRVEVFGESYQEPDGDLWVQVHIETNEGPQVGWVNRRYIS